jgi:hypothetical protein
MPMIWGHVESIVTRRNIPPSLVVTKRTPLGTYRIDCVVGNTTRIAKDF